MMEYNKMISDKIRENELKMIRSYPQPMMFGGVRFLNGHPQASGNDYANPSTLATGSQFFAPSGGNFTKQLQKMGKSAVKEVGKIASKTSRAVANDIPNMVSKSVIPALSKYGEAALTNYLAPAVEEGAEVAVGMGRGRGRPKKEIGGSFKSVMKSVGKVGKQVFNKALPMAEKYAMNTAKTALMDYALPAAETGAEFVAANPEVLLLAAGRKKRGGAFLGLPGKKAIDKEKVKIFGGKRKGRFVKGSVEAKEWGAKMKKIREMKK